MNRRRLIGVVGAGMVVLGLLVPVAALLADWLAPCQMHVWRYPGGASTGLYLQHNLRFEIRWIYHADRPDGSSFVRVEGLLAALAVVPVLGFLATRGGSGRVERLLSRVGAVGPLAYAGAVLCLRRDDGILIQFVEWMGRSLVAIGVIVVAYGVAVSFFRGKRGGH